MASASPPQHPRTAQNTSPLPPGWTEHKAPTGHSYYYNAATKTSTYTRPVTAAPPAHGSGALKSTYFTPAPQSAPDQKPSTGPPKPHTSLPQRPGPPHWQFPQAAQPNWNAGPGGHSGGPFGVPHVGHSLPARPHPAAHPRRPPPRPRQPPQKPDKPRKKRQIVGAEPWVLVTTKAGRQFVHNPVTKASLWKAPTEVQEAIDKLPEQIPEEELRAAEERRLRRRRERREAEIRKEQEELQQAMEAQGVGNEDEEEGEDYEEEEVTAEKSGEGQPAKRIKLDPTAEEHAEADDDDAVPTGPVEYTAEDIEWQLAAMADEYALGPEDLNEDQGELDHASAVAIFTEMLLELNISPYKTWEQVLPMIAEDNRYTVLPNTKTRKEAFLDWCRTRIVELKAEEAKKEKPHPKTVFFEFLKGKSTAKLYWAEFKRKWRKEPEMRTVEVTDKDREKMYRDYVARMKTSSAIRESDLKSLLNSITSLTRNHTPATLPHSVTSDVRYHVCPPESRDSIIQDHLSRLPEVIEGDDGKGRKEDKSALALRERELAVRKERMARRGEEERAKWMLRREEEEIERAKNVGRKGLAAHLKGDET